MFKAKVNITSFQTVSQSGILYVILVPSINVWTYLLKHWHTAWKMHINLLKPLTINNIVCHGHQKSAVCNALVTGCPIAHHRTRLWSHPTCWRYINKSIIIIIIIPYLQDDNHQLYDFTQNNNNNNNNMTFVMR